LNTKQLSTDQLDFCYIKKRSSETIHTVRTPLFNASTLIYTEDKNPIYSTLAKQKTIEDFHQCLLGHIESLGFTLFQICHFEREKMAKQNKKDWFEITQEVLSQSAPTLNHPNKRGEAFQISPVKSAVTQMGTGGSPSYKGELVDIFGSMDFHDTHSISTPAFLGEGFLILTVMASGLTPRTFNELIKQHQATLMTLIDAINAIGGLKFPNFIFDKRSTEGMASLKKPMQALHWASQGYAHKQIAEKMSISYKTVNDHLRSAREDLQAKSTGHAIRLAIEQGLIN